MKLQKSSASMNGKRGKGMDPREGARSYEEYEDISPKPTGAVGQEITIKRNGEEEKFWCWLFYDQDEDDPTNPGHKRSRFRYKGEEKQERYEWLCGGWLLFYDIVVKQLDPDYPDPTKEHKLFFYWDKEKDPKGVAIYINDRKAIDTKDKQVTYSYTLAPASGDPPTVPHPPPPSGT